MSQVDVQRRAHVFPARQWRVRQMRFWPECRSRPWFFQVSVRSLVVGTTARSSAANLTGFAGFRNRQYSSQFVLFVLAGSWPWVASVFRAKLRRWDRYGSGRFSASCPGARFPLGAAMGAGYRTYHEQLSPRTGRDLYSELSIVAAHSDPIRREESVSLHPLTAEAVELALRFQRTVTALAVRLRVARADAGLAAVWEAHRALGEGNEPMQRGDGAVAGVGKRKTPFNVRVPSCRRRWLGQAQP